MPNLQSSAWQLDHIAHAVKDLDRARDFYQNTLGFTFEEEETLPEHQVRAVFLRSGDSLLELIQPLEGNQTLNKFLSERGPGLHHVCYRVSSVQVELARLEKLGVRLIDRVPRLGSRGFHVAFLHPKAADGVLIEIASKTN